MAYFKIGDVDFSAYVNELNVSSEANFNSQTNAAGDTVVDFVNKKREVEVGIIPLDDAAMKALQAAIEAFNVSISYRDPKTGVLAEMNAIIPEDEVQYYTIQADKVMYKAFTLSAWIV